MASTRIFLTGEPRSGKTTAVSKTCDLLSQRGRKIGGIVSGELREGGVRVGFTVENVVTHRRGILAHVKLHEGPRVGKYRVNLADIARIGVTSIMSAVSLADVVIVDEIGPMELHSLPFINAVETMLDSSKSILGTIHKHASHPLVKAIKSNPAYELLEVTSENRGRLPVRLAKELMSEG